MKKLMSLLLAVVMMTTCILPAAAADSGIAMTDLTVQEDTVSVTVILQETVTAKAVSLIYEFDDALLKIVPEECRWIPEGVMADFSLTDPQAVWASEEETALTGKLCTLTFRILDAEKFGSGKINCMLTFKNDSETVGEFQVSSTVSDLCSHQYGDWTDGGEQNHIRKCAQCGLEEQLPHEWAEESRSADPENLNTVVITYRCGICEAEKQETAERILTQIVVSVQPDKTVYMKMDSLDVTGGLLTLTYDDGTFEEIPMTADMVTGFDNTLLGSQELTVSYGGLTTGLTVTVEPIGGVCGDGVSWNYEGGSLTISGSGSMYSYGSSPAPWADYNNEILSVTMEEGVTNAGQGAFAGMPYLTEVSLPYTVTEIAYAAFRDCTSLPSVDLPYGVTTISYNAFENCSGLQRVYLPFELTAVCGDAFAGCTGLTEVRFLKNLQSIEDRAFGNCTGIRQLQFLGSAPSIAQTAFTGIYASANYPGSDASWSADMLQNYGGSITWISDTAACSHIFTDWVDYDNYQQRRCYECGYIEQRLSTNEGSVEVGSLQTDLSFAVDPVADTDEGYILVEEAVSNSEDVNRDILKAFDITLENTEGETVQPDSDVTVKLPLGSGQDGQYKVYRVEEDGTLTDMQATRQGTYLVFTTDHFSIYVIVEEIRIGDVDKSGSLDHRDVSYLIWHTLFPDDYPVHEGVADFDKNEEVTLQDALKLLWHILF